MLIIKLLLKMGDGTLKMSKLMGPKSIRIFMSPVSPVFHTEVTVNIGLRNVFRVVTSIR